MINTLVLDLDGPILDSRFRHYACYSQILRAHGYVPVGLEIYWQMKRECVELREQLIASGAEAIYCEFGQSWLEMIEKPELLKLDQLQPGAVRKLREWRKQGLYMVLASLRRNTEGLLSQLSVLYLDGYFDDILVCTHEEGGLGKARRVREVIGEAGIRRALWVGDTEVDIDAARALGCPVWALGCGIRTEEYLSSLHPNFLSATLESVDISRVL